MAWKKGIPSPNPAGRPRKGTAMAERMREQVDPDELIQIALSIARGEPMVRLLDRETGRPRLADMPTRPSVHHDQMGLARPMPISQAPDDAVIQEIVWPTFSDRKAMLAWITETCGIRAPVPTEIDMNVNHTEGSQADSPIDFERLSPAELDAYVRLVDKASGQALLVSPPDEEGVIDIIAAPPDDSEAS